MDIIQASDDPIIPTLCRATVRWLEETRASLMQQDLFPEHYPFDPKFFQENFPVTRGVVRKTLELYPDFTPFPRRCQIAFADHGRTDYWSRLWSIKFGMVVLGFFEVPSMIYDDPYQRLVVIRKDLILEALVNSINAREKSMLLATPTEAREERDDGIEIRLITESHLGGGRPFCIQGHIFVPYTPFSLLISAVLFKRAHDYCRPKVTDRLLPSEFGISLGGTGFVAGGRDQRGDFGPGLDMASRLMDLCN